MKRIVILLSLGVLLAVSCDKKEQEAQISDVSWTPCKQGALRSSGLMDKVEVEFTSEGIQVTHYNFEVPCDFTTVNVSHTLVNGVLRITQQGSPNLADCICYTDVSYTINGIAQNEVNVIFINGEQAYCYNYNDSIDIKNVQYIRKFGYSLNLQQPIISVISTKSKLEQYYESYVKGTNDFYTGQFLEATKIYSDSFFANNFLVIVLFEEISGSIRHQVERIDKNGDIVINRLIPEAGSDDLVEWNIIIELSNKSKLGQFKAVFVDKKYE